MGKTVFKRLWRSFTFFLLTAAFTLWNRDLLFQFGSEAVTQSQKVLAYIIEIGIWLSAAHFFNRLVQVFFWDGLISRTLGTTVPRLIKDIFTLVVYTIAITGIVGIVFGQDVTAFWATSGVVGIVIGFAVQNMILDVFTGLAINIDRPYKIGDWIKVHGSNSASDIIGKVDEINWRTTRLETEDDSLVVLPNSLLGKMVVTNFWGAGPQSRFETTVCLDFSVSTDRACRVLEAGARAVMGQKGVMENPEPNVIVKKTTPLGIEYSVRYWMSGWGNGTTEGVARSHVSRSILEHLKQAGIAPAYPKQDLFYTEMPARHLDAASVEDRTKLLSETELFKPIENTQLRKLASNMTQVKFVRSQQIIKQGDPGNSMFILSEGLLHVFLRTNGTLEGIKVGQIVPGEFFGEMSLLTGETRGATLVAMTDIVAHEITKENLNGLLTERPEVAQVISKVVAERRVRNSEKMATATPEERVEVTDTLAQQIMGRMRDFFKGVF